MGNDQDRSSSLVRLATSMSLGLDQGFFLFALRRDLILNFLHIRVGLYSFSLQVVSGSDVILSRSLNYQKFSGQARSKSYFRSLFIVHCRKLRNLCPFSTLQFAIFDNYLDLKITYINYVTYLLILRGTKSISSPFTLQLFIFFQVQ